MISSSGAPGRSLMIRHISRRGFAAEEGASAPSRSLGWLFGEEVDRVSVDASPVESSNLFFVFFTLALDRKMLLPSDRSSARAKSSGLSAGDAARSAHDPPMEMRARCR